MAFIKVTRNREGKQHVYLVEGYREGDKVKQRTIHTYGRLDKLEQEEPGILERLKRDAKEGKFNKDSHIEITYDLNAPMNELDRIIIFVAEFSETGPKTSKIKLKIFGINLVI